jgi:hypothetical protein
VVLAGAGEAGEGGPVGPRRFTEGSTGRQTGPGSAAATCAAAPDGAPPYQGRPGRVLPPPPPTHPKSPPPFSSTHTWPCTRSSYCPRARADAHPPGLFIAIEEKFLVFRLHKHNETPHVPRLQPPGNNAGERWRLRCIQ